MNYKDYATRELSLLSPPPAVEVQNAVLALMEKFSEQGHSGASAPYCISYFKSFAPLGSLDEVKAEFLKLGYIPVEQEQEDGPNKWIQENVLELIQVLFDLKAEQRTEVIEYFSKVALFKPLTPLTGEDWEWEQSDFFETPHWQNTRYSSVFKTEEGVHDISGRVFREPSGVCYVNRDSKVPVVFPYEPKKEIVDVEAKPVEVEISREDFEESELPIEEVSEPKPLVEE